MLSLALFVVALILGIITLVQSRGQSLAAWALVCLALGVCLRFGVL